MDLYPDVQDSVKEALTALGQDTDYPFASLFALAGFFLILSIEKLITINDDDDTPENSSYHSFFKTMSLLVAISLHSVFEGLAVGLEPTHTKTLTIFLALLLHKIIIAVSIGINLSSLRSTSDNLDDTPHKKSIILQVVSTLVFSLASPIGLFIGWALMTQVQSGVLKMTTAVLQGFACGTFFFVVFCEILPDEFHTNKSDKLLKLLFLFAGFALISVYMIFMPG